MDSSRTRQTSTATTCSSAYAELEERYLAGEGAPRLEELGATAPEAAAPAVENPASQVISLTLDLLNRGEWEELGALGVVAPDVVRVDRRRGISAPTVHDSVDFTMNAAAIYDVFRTVTPEVIAVRGERLALIRLHCGDAADGFELQLLCVYDFNADGQIAYEADFDGDDLLERVHASSRIAGASARARRTST